jgi:hypothetical protein
MQFLSIFYPGSAVQTMQKPLKPEWPLRTIVLYSNEAS